MEVRVFTVKDSEELLGTFLVYNEDKPIEVMEAYAKEHYGKSAKIKETEVYVELEPNKVVLKLRSQQ